MCINKWVILVTPKSNFCYFEYFIIKLTHLCFFLGKGLHDLQINTGINGSNGTENTCGFYEGPAQTGERVVVDCASDARGSYVLLTILTPPEKTDILAVCEVQIFVNN